MKFFSIYPLLLLLALQSQAQEGIQFFKGSWEEALAQAKKERKLIFMDAYASWCGPCKSMARNVFTKAEAGQYYNKNFINVKMDMEKGDGPKLSVKYSVRSYPTLLFINEKGEIVHQSRGAKPLDKFLALGKAALMKNDKSGDYAKEFEKGDRSPELLRAYTYALMQSSKPYVKIANEYLRSQKDLSTEVNLKFLFDCCPSSDSRIFTLLVQQQKALIALKGEEAYNKRVREICDRCVQKSVEFDSPELLDEAKADMKTARPKFAKEYSLLADISYYKAKKNLSLYSKAIDKYLKKYAKKDARIYYYYANSFLLYQRDKEALNKAENWAKKACALEKSLKHYEVYAALLRKSGKVEQAMEIEKEAAKLRK